MVEGLPVHTFPTDDGGVDMKCPTEIAITDRREAELAKNGLMPLSHWKNTDYAVFVGAQSLQKPAGIRRSGCDRQCESGGAPAVSVRHLPFCALPQVHGARQNRRVRDQRQPWSRGSTSGSAISWTPIRPPPREQSAVPAVRSGSSGGRSTRSNPGYYTSKFFLKPHYQLEGLTVSLRLVSKLPKAKK